MPATPDVYAVPAGGSIHAGTAVPPAWVRSLAAGLWAQVGQNTLQSVDARYSPAANPNYPNRGPWTYNAVSVTNAADASGNIESWGGAALDLTNLRLVKFGVGHDDGGGTEVYSVELEHNAGPLWVRNTDPYLAGGANGALDDGQEATNQHAAGQPRSIHSYGCLGSYQGKLLMASSPAPFKSATSTYGNFWEADIDAASGHWTRLLQETTSGNAGTFFGCAITCLDTLRNRFYGWGNDATNPSYFDLTTRTFHRDTAVQPNINGTESWLVYCADLDVQVCLNRLYSGQIGVYDYGRTPNSGFVNTPGATGNAPGESPTFSTIGYDTRMYHNGAWVPGLGGGPGAIVCWHGGRNLHVATPGANPATDPWAWSLRTISNGGNPGAVNLNGVWGRLRYVPQWKTLVLIRNYSELVWALRLPDAWFEA